VENLPRTGIEYPMMKDLGHAPFIAPQKEVEPLDDRSVPHSKLEEYIRQEIERTSSSTPFQVVYDSIEPSPYYDGEAAKHGPFIDEKEIIELSNPAETSNGAINEPY